MDRKNLGIGGIFVLLLMNLTSITHAQGVLNEWNRVKSPPPPPLHDVTLDPKTTALFMMDFNTKNCKPEMRNRCALVITPVQKFLARARLGGITIIHSFTPNMVESDIVTDVKPLQNERVVQVRGDKFDKNDLSETLKNKGITTIITIGTSANGAVLFTAIGASQRGFKVVVPVDAMPADTAYQEQFSIWEIANGPTIREVSTLTTLERIHF
jgi:nicotinamidase-related amidase